MKNQNGFGAKSIHNLTDSDTPSNHRKYSWKTSRCTNFVCRFLRGIWFHTQREDVVNIASIWSLQRNFYRYDDALQKHVSNGSLTRWWYLLGDTFIQYLFIICLNYVLLTSIKDNGFVGFRCKTTRKYTCPNQIDWSNKQKASVSTWTQIKQNSRVLNKIETLHASEIRRSVLIPRQQYLINWNICQHTQREKSSLLLAGIRSYANLTLLIKLNWNPSKLWPCRYYCMAVTHGL